MKSFPLATAPRRGGAFDRDPVRVIVSDWMMGGPDDYNLAMDAGVDDFMTKPLDREMIRTRLRVAERILRYTTEISLLRDIIPICAYCHKVRSDGDYWERVETYIRDRTGTRFSHGACPECFENQLKGLAELVWDSGMPHVGCPSGVLPPV